MGRRRFGAPVLPGNSIPPIQLAQLCFQEIDFISLDPDLRLNPFQYGGRGLTLHDFLFFLFKPFQISASDPQSPFQVSAVRFSQSDLLLQLNA